MHLLFPFVTLSAVHVLDLEIMPLVGTLVHWTHSPATEGRSNRKATRRDVLRRIIVLKLAGSVWELGVVGSVR